MITPKPAPDHYTTIEVSRLLGLAVRSVQMMVDRGELEAWKTAGGHRRISRPSVERWLAGRQVVAQRDNPVQGAAGAAGAVAPASPAPGRRGQTGGSKVLLIEDSVHFQNLVGMLLKQRFPQVELAVAADGLAGLAMYGQIEPDVLIVDILLPGIDGAALITTLRTHPQFSHSRLIVLTSLDEAQREPYAFALEGVAIVHKPKLVQELPRRLEEAFKAAQHASETA